MTDRLSTAITELVEALREELRTEAASDQRAPDRLLSVADAAALCGISRSHLYTEIGNGRIRTVKSGRRRLVPAGALAAFIADGAAEV